MNNRLPKVLMTTLLVILNGCSQTGAPPADMNYLSYQCDNGMEFEAAYPDQDSAYLRLNNAAHRLERVRSGFGARYESGAGISLHTKGNMALLDFDGSGYAECVTQTTLNDPNL